MVSVEGNWTNGTAANEEEEGRTPRMVFLALIMVVASGGNVLLLSAFLQNKRARQSVHSVTAVNLAALCLGDSVLNMSLVMASLTAGDSWTFGQPLCKCHSFVMSLVLVETSLLITVLVCDRFLAARFLHRYDSLISPVRLVLVLVFTWMQALAFSVPFFLDTVRTTFRLKLHTCAVSEETSLAFICAASVLCFLLPAVLIVVLLSLIFHASCKQRQEVRMMATQNHYCPQLKPVPQAAPWEEVRVTRYVVVLCALWFVLEVPHVVVTYIQQYRLSSQVSFSVEYPWGVDVAFVWMRFSFSALFPCVTFVWRKDLWHCCKERLFCHRSNSVVDIKVTVDPTAKTAACRPKNALPPLKAPPKSKDQSKADVPNMLSFNVPVLFATSDGIHIETPHSDASEAEDMDQEVREHKPKGRQLDITSHSVDLDRLSADTSDYDSEAERYASQPLSTRHIRGALETSSVPNLRAEEQHERGAPVSAKLTSSQGADSGLELSGTMSSAAGKTAQDRTDNAGNEDCGTTTTEDATTRPSTTTDPECKDSGDGGGNRILKSSTVSSSTGSVRKVSVVTEAHPDSRYLSDEADDSSRSGGGDDGGSGLKTVQLQQDAVPSTLPRATPGRLKPLHAARPPKAKTDWPERNLTVKAETRKGDGAGSAPLGGRPTPGPSDKTEGGSSQNCVVDNKGGGSDNRAGGASGRSSKEGRGRGHRRTMTSDSERALLSSDSSMEIQTLKVHTAREAD